jgi:23S rRNA pseudouridine2605 synthase
MERLQKYLSRAGVASRRHAETLIVDGRVKVNNKVVTELGTRVDPGKDLVLLDGKLVSPNAERKYFLFYKPPGVVTTLSDPEGRPTVADYARETGGRVFPVGRLDYDAEGALLLTDDGALANQLMHPSHQVPRVYLAKVKGEPDEASLQKLLDGVRLEDGMAKAVEARVFEKAERNTWVKIVVTEGRQHLVKRLCAAIGHPVVRLYRPAHAGLSVHGLRPGELRALSNDEIRRVKAAASGDAQSEPALYLPARRHGHAAPGFEPAEAVEAAEPRGADRLPSGGRSAPRRSSAGFEPRSQGLGGASRGRPSRAPSRFATQDPSRQRGDAASGERPARQRSTAESAGRDRPAAARSRFAPQDDSRQRKAAPSRDRSAPWKSGGGMGPGARSGLDRTSEATPPRRAARAFRDERPFRDGNERRGFEGGRKTPPRDGRSVHGRDEGSTPRFQRPKGGRRAEGGRSPGRDDRGDRSRDEGQRRGPPERSFDAVPGRFSRGAAGGRKASGQGGRFGRSSRGGPGPGRGGGKRSSPKKPRGSW